MKVLHVNRWDTFGGSARASLRIHTSLQRLGVDSWLLVGGLARATGQRPERTGLLAPEPLLAAGDAIARRVQYALGAEDLFYPSTWALARRRVLRTADVLQLYNTHGGYFAFPAAASLSRRKPVVWRFSDMWPFTGHCPYSGDCTRWRMGCGRCPVFRQYPPTMRRDTTAWHWRHKRRVYRRARITFVAPSRWIERTARESPLIGHLPVEYVPNGVDTNLFRPIPESAARALWGLPADAPIVLLDTMTFQEPRKGSAVVGDLLAQLRVAAGGLRLHLLLAGVRRPACEASLAGRFSFTATGYVDEPRLMATLYNAADLLLHPSVSENLANAAMESLACGTPVFCFDTGGMRDVVADGETGYAAPLGGVAELAAHVVEFLRAPDAARRMASRCRERMESEFSAEQEARRLLAVYERAVAWHREAPA